MVSSVIILLSQKSLHGIVSNSKDFSLVHMSLDLTLNSYSNSNSETLLLVDKYSWLTSLNPGLILVLPLYLNANYSLLNITRH